MDVFRFSRRKRIFWVFLRRMFRKRLFECEGIENKDLWLNELCFYFFEVGGLQFLREKSYFDQLVGRYKYCKELKNFKNIGICSYILILDVCLVLNIENFFLVNIGEMFFYQMDYGCVDRIFLIFRRKKLQFFKKIFID